MKKAPELGAAGAKVGHDPHATEPLEVCGPAARPYHDNLGRLAAYFGHLSTTRTRRRITLPPSAHALLRRARVIRQCF
jgi:hypothetical protein